LNAVLESFFSVKKNNAKWFFFESSEMTLIFFGLDQEVEMETLMTSTVLKIKIGYKFQPEKENQIFKEKKMEGIRKFSL